MTETGGAMDDRRCPMLDVNVVADDNGSRLSAVFFIRSATKHHQ